MKRRNKTISVLALASIISLPAFADHATRVEESRTYHESGHLNHESDHLKQASRPGPITDRAIKRTLDHLIDDYDELDDDVRFTVKDNVVTLKGTVDNLREKQLAIELAYEVNGVHHVIDKLKTETSDVHDDEDFHHTTKVREEYSTRTTTR